MSKILVTGSHGFIGSYLMELIDADEVDLKIGSDACDGFDKKYKTIVFLACNQENSHWAYRENTQMFEALDEYRERYPKTHLIYISSVAVYYPISIYCQSKRLGEYYASRYDKHTILRLSNVYGHGDGHGAADLFQRGHKVINGDGEQIRDIIPVEYVVDVIVDQIKSPEYGTFNVSSGAGVSVNEMFKMFGEGKPKYNKSGSVGVEKSILVPGKIDG